MRPFLITSSDDRLPLFPNEDRFFRQPLIEHAKRGRRVVEREAVGDQLLDRDVVVDDKPSDIRPFPDWEIPGANYRKELANELIARVDLGLARLADERHPAELRRTVQGRVLPGGASRAVDGDVDGAAPSQLTQTFNRILLAAVDRIVGAESPGLLQPALQNVDGDHPR